jgi:hypothetical protein
LDEDVRHALEKLADKVETALFNLRDHIDSKFDALDQKFATKESHDNLKDRVASLESDRRKVSWIIVGAVLAAIIAGVVITKSSVTAIPAVILPTPTSTVTR